MFKWDMLLAWSYRAEPVPFPWSARNVNSQGQFVALFSCSNEWMNVADLCYFSTLGRAPLEDKVKLDRMENQDQW